MFSRALARARRDVAGPSVDPIRSVAIVLRRLMCQQGFQQFDTRAQLLDLTVQRGDHVKLGVGQVLDTPARAVRRAKDDHLGRYADRRRVWGHVVQDHGARADASVIADRDCPENLCTHPDHDVVAQGRVSLPLFLSRPSQGYALIECDVIANLTRFANDDPHPVIDEEAATDARAGMNLDSSYPAIQMRDQAGYDRNAQYVQSMSQPMEQQRMQPGIGEQNLQQIGSRGVTLKYNLNILG